MGISLQNARPCLPLIVVGVLGCHPGQRGSQSGAHGSGGHHGDEAQRRTLPQAGDESQSGNDVWGSGEVSNGAREDAYEDDVPDPDHVDSAVSDTGSADKAGAGTAAGSGESFEMGAEVSAKTSPDGGVDIDAGAAGAASEPDSAITPLAVDAGNPKDVGPAPKPAPGPRLRLHLADAAIADLASAFYLRPTAIEIVDESSALERLPLSIGLVDLLLYRNGNKLLVFDDHVKAIHALTQLRLVLDALEPATIAFADAPPSRVGIPFVGVPALAQDVDIAIGYDVTTDITLHIDLRKNLRDDGAGGYVLLPIMDAFESHTRGVLQATGIDAAVASVACVYREVGSNLRNLSFSNLSAASPPSLETALDAVLEPVQETIVEPVQETIVEPVVQASKLTLQSGDSRCWDAAGSSVIGNDGFRIDYLVPGRYRIRLFLTDTLYVELPLLSDVTAEVVSLVDLSAVGDMIPSH